MGQLKKVWTDSILGYSESKNYIEFNGKKYKNSETNYGYVNYSIVKCPICNKDMLQKYEKDETPGFKDSHSCIVDKICDCKI